MLSNREWSQTAVDVVALVTCTRFHIWGWFSNCCTILYQCPVDGAEIWQAVGHQIPSYIFSWKKAMTENGVIPLNGCFNGKIVIIPWILGYTIFRQSHSNWWLCHGYWIWLMAWLFTPWRPTNWPHLQSNDASHGDPPHRPGRYRKLETVDSHF